MNELSKIESVNATRISRDTIPKLGEWYWVKDAENISGWKNGEPICHDKKPKNLHEVLYCVKHIASNHVQFSSSGGSIDVDFNSLFKVVRKEDNWKAIISKRIEEKQIELQQAVKQMADSVRNADLLPSEVQASETMLPSRTRNSPEDAKKSLIRLKEETFPKAQETVKSIMESIVNSNRDLCLPMIFEGDKMAEAVGGVKDMLFVLELYAGFEEQVKLLKDGKPAPIETPLTIRQMLRYMDEETLIDYDKGGMDFSNLADFDEWIIKQENLERVCPEQRSVTAFKVRRHEKSYEVRSMFDAFRNMEKNYANMATYLLVRNGEQVFRLATEIDFEPRLLPFKKEFEQPFEEINHGWMGKPDTVRQIMPDDFDYDDHVKERKQKMFAANRILFLLQGLLDRSKVFSPHPMIDLSNYEHVVKYLRLVYDEENGLPSANPPKWEEYRDAKNALLKRGDYVYCTHYPDHCYRYEQWAKKEVLIDSRRRPEKICQISGLSRDGKSVKLRWSKGDHIKERWVIDETRPVPNKPRYFYKKRLEENFGERFGNEAVPIEECFNVSAYEPGDYKKFLCDAYLKGAYLEWAPQLLSAEKWHMESRKESKQ